MSLPHALLTALLEHAPATGFELARRFDRSMGYYWHASHQQIYRELAQMEAQGWVSTTRDPQDSRRKLYAIEGAGRDELLRWVHTPSAPVPLRESLMIKLRADSLLGPCELEDEIRQRIAQHEKRLAQYQHMHAQFFAQMAGASRQVRMQRLILETGMAYEQHSADIFNQLLQALGEASASSGNPPVPPHTDPA